LQSRLRDVMTKALGVLGLATILLAPAAASAQVVSYYHLDAVGNVLAVTDQAGVVVEQHDYLPFGEEWNPTPGTQPIRFTGKERDTETGLDYFGARYYGSNIARFTTVDPASTIRENILDPQRWNKYAYALNNPLRYVDPDGRDAIWVQHKDGTATLVIPVQFAGSGATQENVAAIVARVNGLTLPDQAVKIEVISTEKAINGKLNHMDFSPGLDLKMCPEGECTNRMGGTRAHIDSSGNEAVGAAAHDILHFAGVDEGYIPGPRDAQGRRTSSPKPGFTNSNVMTSRAGTELKSSQLEEAQRNASTKKCSGAGNQCQ
jgi:RHS repeat-associated protein